MRFQPDPDQRRRWWVPQWPRGQGPSRANKPETDGAQSASDEESDNEILTTLQQNCRDLHKTSQLLIEREECLFGEITEQAALKDHKEDVDKLADDYGKLKDSVLQIVQRSLILGLEEVQILTSAIKAICQEEEQDQLWKQRNKAPPAWRPCDLKKHHNKILRNLAKERLDNPQTPSAVQSDQTSIQADVTSMGRQMKEDLVWVVSVVKLCYPPEMNICNVYAGMYHQTFSARLRKIADFGLEDKDCAFLLRWVNEYYPEMLKKSELADEINSEALEKLLPLQLLAPLEEQYLDKQQSDLTILIGRVLRDEEQKWIKGEEPKLEYGCYVSPVAYDVIQFVNGMVTAAEKVVGDRQKAQGITRQLTVLMNRFKTFQDNIINQNSPSSKAYVKACLHSVQQFRDVVIKTDHLLPEDVRKPCLSVLAAMKQSAHTYLLSPVHKFLKPQYRKLGTSDWLDKDLFDKLLVSLSGQIHDLQGLTESCHQELICQFHQEVTEEYVKRLLKGQVKLKDKERQRKAKMVVNDNAERLHEFFSKMGSKEAWLKGILTTIAEVLELQDLGAIQMEVASLGSTYPDLSEKHVSALLKLKTNFSKAKRKTVKETLSDTLKHAGRVNARPFFSRVQVK